MLSYNYKTNNIILYETEQPFQIHQQEWTDGEV